jgi:cellulose 1,4-beta-cellobiosidase
MSKRQFVFRLALATIVVFMTTMTWRQSPVMAQAVSCAVTYSVNDWNNGGGFTGMVDIRNNGAAAINGWTITWTYANQRINQMWNATFTQNAANAVTATNLSYNSNIPANGGSVNFGFNAQFTGSNPSPTNWAVNGVACGGQQPTATRTNTPVGPTATRTNTPVGPTATRTNTPVGPTATRTNTPVGPTNTPTRTNTPVGPTATRTNTPVGPTSTPTRTPTNPPQGTHLENPFSGATFYRNVDYTASVNAAANLQGGTLAPRMRQVANFPTFVWLDSIDAVNGTNGYPRSLVGHLDAALAQGANAIGIVVYDLPNRDCSALASNGELLIAQNGMNRYRTEYIDQIFAAVSQPRFSNLRIVMVIEPDSLPNLITNLSFPKCSEAQSTGAYVQGVQYAIGTLRAIPNTYAYIDVGHHGWLGWPNNMTPFVSLLKTMGAGVPGGIGRIDGFIGNTANTGPTVEPFMTANQMIGQNPVRSLQGWYDWNDYIDEQSYLIGLRNNLTSGTGAFPTSIGMLIDTSRNGWGGPNRPTGPSTSTDLFTFVMATRIDKRIHKGNWCNQNGAGIGARPTAAPAAGFDAWVWVKPPGESDGSSSLIPQGPENPGNKGFDRMCDPTYTGNSLNGNNMSGALGGAPVSGRWFQAQFVQLVTNAFPVFP